MTYVLQAQEMFKDVLESFRNLLQSGDEPSAKKLVKDLDIPWASKGGKMMYCIT